jgi:hypothetical protein
VVLYNVACIYSLAHEIEMGIETLKKSLEAGFVNREWLEMDPDLDPLRSSPSFAEIMALTG